MVKRRARWRISGGLVSLLSAPGRSSDHPSLNRLFGRVIPPSGMSSASYFQELQSADAFYCDCVDYDLFPGMANGYNSNSYVNSLIRSGWFYDSELRWLCWRWKNNSRDVFW